MTVVVGMMILAVATLILLAVGLMMKSERHIMLNRLRQYGYEAAEQAPVLTDELVRPFADRIVHPALARMVKLVGDMTPRRTAEALHHRLEMAGDPLGLSPTEFSALKGLGLVAGLVAGSTIAAATGLSPVQKIAVICLLAFIGFAAPDRWLSSKIAWRRNEIQRALPNSIDLLNVSIEAGLGFDAAISRITDKTRGPLSDEFKRALQEMRMGKARVDALRGMVARTEAPDLAGFVATVYQAEELGASMTTVLRVQGQMIRSRRRMRAREIAAKLPVKMLFPLVFCIFPSIFLVVLGPGVIQLSKTVLAK